MLRFRGSLRPILPGLLLTLLLLIPGCAGEESATENLPGRAIASELLETEAGEALAAVLVEAGETDRLVFVHTGADW